MQPRIFKPMRSSFFRSLFWPIIPAILGGITVYWGYQNSWWFQLVSGSSILLVAMFLFRSTFAVHRKLISIDDEAISTFRSGRENRISWSQVTSATLRVRHNHRSRRDTFLKITTSSGGLLIYNPSVLSLTDEKELLQEIQQRAKVRIIREADKLDVEVPDLG